MIEFKDEMPDYINKILKEKLPPSTRPYDQEDRVPLLAPVDKQFDPEMQHIPPPPLKLEQNGVGVTDTPTKITRGMFLELKRTQALLKLVRA